MTEFENSDMRDEFYMTQSFDTSFGRYDVKDEDLHHDLRAEKPHYTLTETQYYSFFVPKENLHCFIWLWCHPNLGSVSGGVMAWKGVKTHVLACELFEFRNHMSTDVFNEGFMNFKLDSGLEIRMDEPGKRWRIRYDDPERDNHIDIIQTAVSEPLVWPSNNHFEQVMHSSGKITLRGEAHDVDCFSVRDRSFGEYRLENSFRKAPPNYWITGVFDENFSFCVVGMDDPQRAPFWKGEFDVAPEAALRFGWLIVDGKKVALKSASIRTAYDRQNLFVRRMELALVDIHGGSLEISGEVGAVVPFVPWTNARAPIALTHWRSGDRKGVGEIQSIQYTDFVHAYLGTGDDAAVS